MDRVKKKEIQKIQTKDIQKYKNTNHWVATKNHSLWQHEQQKNVKKQKCAQTKYLDTIFLMQKEKIHKYQPLGDNI